MNSVWTIARNDLRIFLKDKSGYLWLFAMPLAFILFFGVSMRNLGGQKAVPRPSVEIYNQDEGYLGDIYVELLQAEGLWVVDSANGETADRKITIPPDFTKRIQSAEEVDIDYAQSQNSSAQPAAMVELRMNRAIVVLTSAIFSVVSSAVEAQIEEQSIREFIDQQKHVTLETNFAGRRKIPAGFDHSAPANTVMFVLMNSLIFGGLSLASERANGVLRRVAVHPLAAWQIVLGKILGRFLLGVVQIIFFLLVGRLLGVNYGAQLLLVGTTLSLLAWGCAALGVFVGSVVKTPETVPGVCMLLALPMGALGGCWWPLEIVPELMRKIAFLFPTGWALHAIQQLVSFEGGFQQVQLSLAVLASFAAVTTWLSAKFFSVE